MLKIQEHLIEHGLEKTIEKFSLNTKNLGHKIIFKYGQLNSPKAQEVSEARGLILKTNTWEIVSMPFVRFFNYNDFYAAKLNPATTIYMEKRDGSLIQVYWDDYLNEWCVNTMFSEANDNFKLKDFNLKDLFSTKMKQYDSNFGYFTKGLTYIFELTSPYNKVVVDYPKVELRLIGCRNLTHLMEYDYYKLQSCSKRINIPLVETYNFSSIDECLKSFENKSFNFEGYVAFDGVNRVKIKNPAYVCVHLTKMSITDMLDLSNPYIFLDIIKQNEIDEFKSYFPYATDLIDDLYKYYNLLLEKLNDAAIQLKRMTSADKKEFARNVLTVIKDNELDQCLSSVFFMMENGKVKSIEEYIRNYDNKKLIKLL